MYKVRLVLLFILILILSSCRKPSTRERYFDKDFTVEENFVPDEEEDIKIVDEQEECDDEDDELSYMDDNVLLPRLLVNKPEQILQRVGYLLSYNSNTRNANWVAWHLTKEHTLGSWSRDGIPYMVDEDVKGPRQELEDWYGHSLPIDHGHLCPAGDCKWSREAMEQSFLLTNMCPQNSNLNRGGWENLESRCRGWARHYGDVYIVAGPIFYLNEYKTIGNNKVGVPDAFFKVVLCMTEKPKALGFIYPNDSCNHQIEHYILAVDEVEQITNIDFFYNLPDDLEMKVESEANIKEW